MTKICVIGLGYIGLPTASMFATQGYKVVGVDVNKNTVNIINNGEIHIEEPDIKTLVQAAVNSKNLIAKTEPEEADVFIICVPTPLDKKEKKAGLNYVISATEAISKYVKKGNLIILESTVPPGTLEGVMLPIIEKKINRKNIYAAHCPERVIPGKILKELVENDRIIGGINKESAEKAKELYENFVEGDIYLTDSTTAEMVKLMENTFRDVNIALANELTKIAEKLNINIWEAIKLANKHPRVNIHSPGPGVGGHCISIDPWFIAEKFPKEAELITLSRNINDSMPDYVVEIIKKEVKDIENPTITIFGVSYKGNVDDARETPALKIIELLKNKDYKIKIYDPHVKEFKYNLITLYDAVKDSDCIVVIADHEDFKKLDIDKIGNLMKNKILIDTRNYLEPDNWGTKGFKVKVLGVPENDIKLSEK
ncbi:UDP-N-acetyl-D-mannosamine dehydrogenase [Candidatus Altiarchaeales archaeon WOR_SM1_SCG]|nr:UDP-N-acetyl-D-mannosamine dehydrogenase [Candidatus Altiarchaeales archaeon WOR_SM1_SCG]